MIEGQQRVLDLTDTRRVIPISSNIGVTLYHKVLWELAD
jgi:hypothetical protein